MQDETPTSKVPKLVSTSSTTFVKHVPRVPATRLATVLELPAESFAAMAETLQRKQLRRDGVQRGLQACVRDSTSAVHLLHRGDMAAAQDAIARSQEALKSAMHELGDEIAEGERYGPLSHAMESFIKAQALAHFLETGALLKRSEVDPNLNTEPKPEHEPLNPNSCS